MKNTHINGLSRRQILRLGGASLAALAGSSSLPAMRMQSTARTGANPTDYKAIVCIFMLGGADTFNLLVPTGASEYATYATSRGDLAESFGSLLPINPLTPGSSSYGLHSQCAGLQNLFQTGKLAFVANLGPLVRPLTKTQYLSGQFATPNYLFSHNDQRKQWHVAHADGPIRHGWAGRLLDGMQGVNGSSPISPGISIDVSSLLLSGQRTSPYIIGNDGTKPLDLADVPARRALIESIMDNKHPIAQEFGRRQVESIEINDELNGVLPSAPSFAGLFGTDQMALQLRMVAQLISVRQQLGAHRQIFFVRAGNYDTHDDQINRLPIQFSEMSAAISGFQTAMESVGESQSVTSFVHSEFGRTLSSNGQGSDHGWGGHSFAVGGGVRGQEIYGTMPNLTLGGPDDVGQGRILPTTGVEQYAATLATWFGVPVAELPALFPNLVNFGSSDLGFMS